MYLAYNLVKTSSGRKRGKKMHYRTHERETGAVTGADGVFHPHRLITDEEFNRNLNLLIAYYQMTKGTSHRRFRSGS
jgi:hypothetical protein